MDHMDTLKTKFMSKHDNFYYNATPFRLKNTWATNQMLIDAFFWNKIECNLKVYIDDIIMNISEGEAII